MQAELAILLQILEAQRSFQAALVELSEKKVKAIAAGDAATLQGIVGEETGILSEIKSIERKQRQCVAHLAVLLGVPVDAVRMSFIIDHAQGEQKEQLVRIREELSILIDRQVKLNQINMKLLQMNMDYVQFLINAASNQKTAPTYGNGGNMQKTAGSFNRLLDRKV